MSFYESIAKYYHFIFPLNMAQVAFVRQSSEKTRQLELLDIGCGIGELSFELSRHFKKVNAIDLDDSMIRRAEQDVGAETGNLNFSVLNMLEIEKNLWSPFAGFYCLFWQYPSAPGWAGTNT